MGNQVFEEEANSVIKWNLSISTETLIRVHKLMHPDKMQKVGWGGGRETPKTGQGLQGWG